MNGGFEYWSKRKLNKHQESATQPGDSVIRTYVHSATDEWPCKEK
jgi:hypothetical protein